MQELWAFDTERTRWEMVADASRPDTFGGETFDRAMGRALFGFGNTRENVFVDLQKAAVHPERLREAPHEDQRAGVEPLTEDGGLRSRAARFDSSHSSLLSR